VKRYDRFRPGPSVIAFDPGPDLEGVEEADVGVGEVFFEGGEDGEDHGLETYVFKSRKTVSST